MVGILFLNNVTFIYYNFSIIKFIKDSMLFFLGVRVLVGVDGTNLNEHPILKTELFDKIIFNFPHAGGKMRIEKNRELLRNFFISASDSLKNNGLILVTLCNGQGGTVVDNPPRRWDDSWKIVEMAAHGNFVLKSVVPFAWSSFQNYAVTGYRSLDKQFHSAGALTHMFVKSEAPNGQNIAPKEKINIFQCNNDSISWKDINERAVVLDISLSDMYSHTYTFDITFSIAEQFDVVEFYTLLYNYAGLIISDVNFITLYRTPDGVEKRTYRIDYKSSHFPLFRKRVIDIHQNFVANIVENNLNVTVSR